MLAGGLPPAGGVTTPGAFPLRGVDGTPVREPRRWARRAAAFRRGERSQWPAAFRLASPPAHLAEQQARQAQPSAASRPTQVQQALVSVASRPTQASRRSSGGFAARRRGRRGSPRWVRGWRANPRQRFDLANTGPGHMDRDRSGRLYGGYVAWQRRRRRRRRPKRRHAGRRYTIAMIVFVMLERDRADDERNSNGSTGRTPTPTGGGGGGRSRQSSSST